MALARRLREIIVVTWPRFQHQSVTRIVRSNIMPRDDLPFCDCRWLEEAAHDPTCQVEFDPELNEYNLRLSNGGIMRIYHCPFCAGRAPASLRAKMFATVSSQETGRLHLLTNDLKTEAEVLVRLGQPTQTFDPGLTTRTPDEDDKAGAIRTFKTLSYDNYSETATIEVHVSRHGEVEITFSGKYVGKPSHT